MPKEDSHAVHSDRLMLHAYEQLEKGDRQQASEKAWGAVAHRLKIVADHRGFPFKEHRDIYRLQRVLIAEYPDSEKLSLLFANAHGLHKNFYIDSVPIEDLRARLGHADELLTILERPEFSGA